MTFPPLAFWAFSGLFGALFVLMEVVKRRTQIRGTVTRKILHVSTALISMALPSYLTPGWLLVLAGVFTGVLALSKAFKVFTSIHEVPRKTWGEVVFPLGIGLAAWLVYYGLDLDPELATRALRFGLLTMGILDVAAEWGGQIPSPKLWFGKSVAGSLSFFAVGLMLCAAHGIPLSITAVASIFGLTVSESVLGRGLDNLALPSLGALAYLLLATSN
ncbi:MAG: hypothetical protein ACO3HG_01045 [Schleiferiaceae bacterium]